MMSADAIILKGRLRVFNKKTMEIIAGPWFNTITSGGYDWFLRQSMGAYGTSRPIVGMRIGNGGADGFGRALTNDPTLTDVRTPIVSTIEDQDYLPITEVIYDTSPHQVTINAEFSSSMYASGDFNSNAVINEAGLWVRSMATTPVTPAIMVSYTVLRNDSGALVEIPVIDSLDLLFRWEIRVQ